jgi:hypothetical protein
MRDGVRCLEADNRVAQTAKAKRYVGNFLKSPIASVHVDVSGRRFIEYNSQNEGFKFNFLLFNKCIECFSSAISELLPLALRMKIILLDKVFDGC